MIKVLTCTLCLTHDCTLRCNYCYAGRKYRHAMTQETAKKAIDLCMAEAQRMGRGLDLSFFGGEPLMNWQVVKDLVAYGRSLEEPNNKKFRFTVTSHTIIFNLTPAICVICIHFYTCLNNINLNFSSTININFCCIT